MPNEIARLYASEVAGHIEELGFDSNVYAPEDIIPETASILVDDIRSGEAGWPVLTGYSRDSFYSDEAGRILNDAPYAQVLEYRGRYVANWIAGNLRGAVEQALDLLGAASGREMARARRLGISAAEALITRGAVRDANIQSMYGLSLANRRLLRTFRPSFLFREVLRGESGSRWR